MGMEGLQHLPSFQVVDRHKGIGFVVIVWLYSSWVHGISQQKWTKSNFYHKIFIDRVEPVNMFLKIYVLSITYMNVSEFDMDKYELNI